MMQSQMWEILCISRTIPAHMIHEGFCIANSEVFRKKFYIELVINRFFLYLRKKS